MCETRAVVTNLYDVYRSQHPVNHQREFLHELVDPSGDRAQCFYAAAPVELGTALQYISYEVTFC